MFMLSNQLLNFMILWLDPCNLFRWFNTGAWVHRLLNWMTEFKGICFDSFCWMHTMNKTGDQDHYNPKIGKLDTNSSATLVAHKYFRESPFLHWVSAVSLYWWRETFGSHNHVVWLFLSAHEQCMNKLLSC